MGSVVPLPDMCGSVGASRADASVTTWMTTLDARPSVPPDGQLLPSAADVTAGKALYHTYCSTCHGDSATGSGVLPDLRFSGLLKSLESWDLTVRQGARADKGMVAFKEEISPRDLEKIRAYVIHRANEDKTLEAAGR